MYGRVPESTLDFLREVRAGHDWQEKQYIDELNSVAVRMADLIRNKQTERAFMKDLDAAITRLEGAA